MKSLDKVFHIIDLLKVKKEKNLRDISREIGLTKSTAHRILSELIRHRYVYKDKKNVYRLGYKFLELGNYVLREFDIREIAKESMDKLNALTKETIHLALFVNDQAIYIDKRDNHHSIRMYSQIGKIIPLHCTALGKVFLAFKDPQEMLALLDSMDLQKYTESTITSKEALLKELDKVQKQGFGLDVAENVNHTVCIAAPIWNGMGHITAAISITVILYSVQFEEIMQHKDLLISECSHLSKRLGYTDEQTF